MIGFYLVNLDHFQPRFFNLRLLHPRRDGDHGGQYKKWASAPSPIFAHLGMGAMFVLALSGLWYARPPREVWRTISAPVAPGRLGEVLSIAWRSSACAPASSHGCLALMAGMPLPVIDRSSPFVLFIGLTRVVSRAVRRGRGSTTAMGCRPAWAPPPSGQRAWWPGLATYGGRPAHADDDLRDGLRMGGWPLSRRPLAGAIFLAILIGLFALA